MDSSKQLGGQPAPLRKTNAETGVVYKRFPANQEALTRLHALPRAEVVTRCEIEDERDPNYVPSECIVSLVRSCRDDTANPGFERLYSALMIRIIQRLPKAETKDGKKVLLKESRIQEGVIDNFQELLALDRISYEERLDFWEIAFGLALKKLKCTVENKVWRETNRSTTLENPETGQIWAHVSEAVGFSDPFDAEELLKKDYREQLPAAIDRLSPEHRRIVKMCLEEYPAYSTDPEAISIAKVLKVSDKTARNRRTEALAALRGVLEQGGRR